MAINNSLDECRQQLENLVESSHHSTLLLKTTMEKLGVIMATIKSQRNNL